MRQIDTHRPGLPDEAAVDADLRLLPCDLRLLPCDLRLLRKALASSGGSLSPCAPRLRGENIPLEQVERELAHVLRIELAHLLARAHAIRSKWGRASGGGGASDAASVRALQADATETIQLARSSGVAVPRVCRRLVGGDPGTWPALPRLARWAGLLDPAFI